MICTPRVGSDYPRDINCSCPQPKGCHNWQDARLSVDEKDKAFYDFVSTHHEKHTHSTINRDRCTDTHYVGNLPNETVCVDVAPPVIFLLGDNPTFLTSCIVCFDDHHPNSTHTDYTDKGAISYDYFDGEKKELKGHLQGTIRPVQDAPPSEKKQLLQALVAHGYDSNEDVSYSVYRYEASDRSGNVVTFDRHVFYITTNISKEVKKLVELQRQLDSIGEAISYAKQFLTAVIVIALFWFLFTAEGKNLLYTIFLKITHPGWTWAEAVLEVEKKKIMNDLGHIKDSRSQVNQYSEGK